MAAKFVQEFQKFIMRGSVVDLAVGFTVGAAFSTVVKSLVSDVIMPPIGLVLGRVDFTNLFLLLKPGEQVPPPYATLADAQKAGAVTLNYGLFVNSLIALSIVAMAMFVIIRVVNRIDEGLEKQFGPPETQPAEPANRKCPYYLSTIPYRATRCPQCTSQLDPQQGQPV